MATSKPEERTVSAPRFTVDDLDDATCLRLLRSADVGRVGFTDRALPRILPVLFTVHADEVVISTRRSATLDLRPGLIVAFEVDEYDRETGQGWCVSLVGACRGITDRAEIAELDALEIAPWSSREGGVYFGVSIHGFRGRLLGRRHEPLVSDPHSSA
jgi:hypothetical protein